MGKGWAVLGAALSVLTIGIGAGDGLVLAGGLVLAAVAVHLLDMSGTRPAAVVMREIADGPSPRWVESVEGLSGGVPGRVSVGRRPDGEAVKSVRS